MIKITQRNTLILFSLPMYGYCNAKLILRLANNIGLELVITWYSCGLYAGMTQQINRSRYMLKGQVKLNEK